MHKTIIIIIAHTFQIGVVKFGEAPITPKGSVKNSTCYESKLALATPRNKEYLMVRSMYQYLFNSLSKVK